MRDSNNRELEFHLKKRARHLSWSRVIDSEKCEVVLRCDGRVPVSPVAQL